MSHKKSIKTILLIPAITMALSACINSNHSIQENTSSAKALIDESTTNNSVALKDLFLDKYKIGTALSREQIMGQATEVLPFVNQQFNAITPENSMKWERIHPSEGVYDFEAADALVEFANKNNHFFTGHTLVWHSQVPDWVFEDKNGKPLNRAQLLKRMEEHINAVAGRYAGKIDAWDVVNEALNEDGSLRESKWSTIIGDDFIEQAFIMAAKAAPKAKLYYNDYNLYKPEKRNGVLKLVKSLQNKGIRIDGVGMQAHYSLTSPELNEIEDSIKAYSALNMDVLITELDVSVIPFPDEDNMGADVSLNFDLQAEFNPYPDGLPTEVENQLGARYQELFAIFNRHQDVIKRVTFWGVSDAQTWRNDWPMTGRSDYPLLFDRQLKTKSFVLSLSEQ
ncbi:endo-1,4-beta-xylanase [Colwellia sp. C1TZA3]|uniref:endo-1,4-beta-xylanase n=1 Tax=Colwellia sp. C1TZA3 TaxID=2508879 RepID=UPI001CB8B0CD|nr:endo-1,4-beta-xylanase [Colwellia sp. C1TZA3]